MRRHLGFFTGTLGANPCRYDSLLRSLFVTVFLFSAGDAIAVTNLPAVCSDESALGKADCPAASYKYDYAIDQSIVKSAGIWQRLLTVTATVMSCPGDATVGGNVCPVPRGYLDKALLAVPPIQSWEATVTWQAPSAWTDGSPLAATDITGYRLSWHKASDVAGWVDVSLPSTPLVVKFAAPATQICAVMVVLTAENPSAASALACGQPIRTPNGVTQLELHFEAVKP